MERRRRRNLSPEAREKLSRLAMQRHAEGKLGQPRRYSKRLRRRVRVQQRVAEAAMEEENARKIIQVFKDAIDPSQRMSTRLKGATAWVQIAQQFANYELQSEAQEYDHRTRDELIEEIRRKLQSGAAGTILRDQLTASSNSHQEVIEAEVIEESHG